LEVAGVVHSPAATSNSIPGAAVVVFRDPDNIQLEVFFDPSGADPATRPRR
jgi:glyoxylase I family protein